MASSKKVASDFDAIIEAGRKRKENEDLAKEIFSRNRQKDNRKKDDKRPGRPATPSLASRVGITKRSSSTSSNNPSPKLQPKSRTSLPNQTARANRIASELNKEAGTNIVSPQSNILPPTVSSSGNEISIKGASGPFVLHASNFAPGTTAADIESALHPDTLYNNSVPSLVSCKIVNTKPDVVAELVFTEKVVADNIISKYNGQKADGRILQVELVRSGVGSMSKAHSSSQQSPQPQSNRSERRDRDRQPRQQQQQQQQQLQSQPQPQILQEPEVEFEPEIAMTDDNAMEDLDMEVEAPAPELFDYEREAADRDRRDRDARRDREPQYEDKRPNEDDRRRGGDRNRDHDRERDRDRHRGRERDYGHREERPREERRGTMGSHYGNGVGGVQRGSFGGGFGGGPGGPGGFGAAAGSFNTPGGFGGSGGPGGTGGHGGFRGGRYGDGYTGGRGGGYRGGYRGYR